MIGVSLKLRPHKLSHEVASGPCRATCFEPRFTLGSGLRFVAGSEPRFVLGSGPHLAAGFEPRFTLGSGLRFVACFEPCFALGFGLALRRG